MSTVRDDLADVLAKQINKQFKGIKAVHFLDGSNMAPTDVSEYISTGSSILDIAISNRPNGGVPVGRIIELTGLESSGKSLIGAHILKETQRKNGIAVYIDTENSVSREFMSAIGVDLSKMLYCDLEKVEDIFAAIESIVTKIREADKDKLVTILVDSVAGASTTSEMEGDFNKEGWATDKALIISRALRKITQMIGKQRICLVFTNQLRVRLGVTFGDPYCVDPTTTKIKIRYKI